MYKPILKTRFMGKNINYLTSCHSTNDIAAHKVRSGLAGHGEVFITDEQTAGRGQQGSSWKSETGQNLTFSFVLKPERLLIKDQFRLSQCIALGVRNYAASVAGEEARIKWPNDVLIGEKKVSGILIENSVRGNLILSSVVGIGINLNQTTFPHERITSLAKVSGLAFRLDAELEKLLLHLEACYACLESGDYAGLNALYLGALFGLGETRSFTVDGLTFQGTLLGVTPEGRLRVLRGGDEQNYDVKEIAWVW